MSSFNVFKALVVLSILGFCSVSIQAQAPNYRYHFCSNATNFTPNSTYQSNLNLLLSSLTSNASLDIGFYYTTVGSQEPTAEVYGSFLCRGDLTPDLCKQCVATIAKDGVQKYCPLGKIAVLWYDLCMLRYSNQSFLGKMDEVPRIFLYNTGNITEPTRFAPLLAETLNGLVAPSSNAPSGAKKYATKEATFTGFQNLYSLVQCTPDLSSTSCDRCLRGAIAQLPGCCNGAQGANVLYPSCNVRYEVYPFYTTEAATPSPSPPSLLLPPPPPGSVKRSQGKSKISGKTIVAIAVPIFVSLVLFVIGYCLITKRAKKKYNAVPEPSGENDISSVESLQFDFVTIEAATNNFSDDNKLGEGGFGQVYKGLLSDGQEIAVKRLSRNSGQGAQEFKNEMVLVAKLQHRNLVRLLGFCLEGQEKILVYEYVSNKSLDHFLFDPEKQGQLDWQRRYKVIAGIARGIIYLHEDSQLRIIHRDLKASNILLDREMHPKISDFGMARIFGIDQTQANTNRIVGTYGYMSPEYAMHGQFSVKSDLYSFGVLVLEIISGKKNSYFFQTDAAEDLVSHTWKLWRDGTPLELLDPCLRDSFSRSEVIRCIHIGLLCVQEDPADRPTMQSLILMLNSYSVTLPLPQEPAFFHRTRSEFMPKIVLESDQYSISKSSPSVYEGSITEVYPR